MEEGVEGEEEEEEGEREEEGEEEDVFTRTSRKRVHKRRNIPSAVRARKLAYPQASRAPCKS